MARSYWTFRYTAARIADDHVNLSGPLELAWRVRPGTPALGWVRAGEGRVVTNVGKAGAAYCLDVISGKDLWTDSTTTACFAGAWKGAVLVYGGEDVARLVNLKTGTVEWKRKGELGLNDGYVIGDVFVGHLAGVHHTVELNELKPLWSVHESIRDPLVGDEHRVIRGDADVTCYALRSGKVLWRRTGAELGGAAYRCGCIWRGQYIVFLGDALTSLDVRDGRTMWRCPLSRPMYGWYPYAGRGYCLLDASVGVYAIIDLEKGQQIFEKVLGPRVPEPVRKDKVRGLSVGARGADATPWRDTSIVVSETHAFLTHGRLGRVVVLERDTGEVVQCVEFGGMPTIEPVIYNNHLLIADFNATVHCFRGAA